MTELERERQAAFVSLSREWMNRQQEIIEQYGLNKKVAQSRDIGPYKELPQETIDVTPRVASTPSTVVVSNPLLMNCNYAKSGPTNCVSERQEADGVYRMCSIGQQIRSRIMLPHLLTSVYNQTGCPSNPLGPFRCIYIKYEKVKVG